MDDKWDYFWFGFVMSSVISWFFIITHTSPAVFHEAENRCESFGGLKYVIDGGPSFECNDGTTGSLPDTKEPK